ncbi:MAG: transketolase [Nanoarchaeota archaeon]|nr:transketolase [Nanoarchaeota archaeon]
MNKEDLIEFEEECCHETDVTKLLAEKSAWVRKETLRIHKTCREIRIASCLSDIEIFTVLYYGKILNIRPNDPLWGGRDRFIVSKAHGAVSLYPVLADFGFFDRRELERVCMENSIFGSIPDCRIPGFETINGSLGHGLGVACGIALALKRSGKNANILVLMGDGELNEGSVWEAIMFAAHHRLDNLLLIIDKNEKSMLDYCKNAIDLEPLDEKFKAFNWKTEIVDGHNVRELYYTLKKLKEDRDGQPKVLIANTVKGKGVPRLEADPLCHIKSLEPHEIDEIIGGLDNGCRS